MAKRAQNPINGHPKTRNEKTWIASKNLLIPFVSGSEEACAFSCRLPVLAQNIFWAQSSQNQEKQQKLWFQRKLPKTKNDTFLGVVFCGMGEKLFLLTVFLESCVLLKALFLQCFHQITAVAATKMYVDKKQKISENSGLFLNMAKRCFCLRF